MTGDLDMLVRVNLTQFSCGWLVSGEDDIRHTGKYLTESSRALLRERTLGYIDFHAINSYLEW